ncbi:PQQ-binding-like beta-propeller repeat protein [Mariniblastus fucicola]|uniref:Outer membrane protein assembly factor BamB n=1 Tax=Mariniblastus fucicola TaxID=980251 RepID=A0A5B9P5K0_9BACT|nr:PQQ-binding-like beta-propeller repeat protein [Mariniblastus fucicola]QEG20200.1 Outer membrane protein assembly factor BamB precursor [Mariniblastus fucicola]
MKRQLPILIVAISFLTAQAAFAQSSADDWTQWRGQNRDGIAEVLWPDTLSVDKLVEERSIALQPGYSGPIVVGDTVFVTETQDKKNEVVKAIRISDGSELWSASWEGSMRVPFFASANGSWIRATPAWDEGRLYVAGMKDVLVCLDAETGKQIWKRDFPADSGTKVPDFGFVSSPLIDGEYVYVQAGGCFQKLNKKTGDTVWKSLDDGGGMNGSAFSSPSIATFAGKRQAVVLTRTTLNGVDLESGQKLWSQEIPAFRGMNIVTPTVFEDGIFLSTYGGTSQFFEVSQSGGVFQLTEKWKAAMQGYMTTPVVVDGHAYLRLRNQRFVCFDLKTGEVKWRTKPYGKYASLIAAGDRIMALDERGDLILFRANPEKFEVVDQRKVADDSWAHLAATSDRLFVRDLNALKIFRWKKTSGEVSLK